MSVNQKPKGAGITNREWCANLFDVSRPQENGDGSWMIADPPVSECRQPPLASGDSIPTLCQNVAGLWLKYGAKSLKIETSSRCEILLHDATIC
jgi:hypothetical protein